ncbi:hypothetical protein V8C35DRAFT_141186 [Trichoderma chlorosporum]
MVIAIKKELHSSACFPCLLLLWAHIIDCLPPSLHCNTSFQRGACPFLNVTTRVTHHQSTWQIICKTEPLRDTICTVRYSV